MLLSHSSKVVGVPAPRLPGPPRRGLGLTLLRETRCDLLKLLERLHAEYGGLCATRMGQRLMIDVFDPDVARTLLVDHADHIERWPRIGQVVARCHGRRSMLASDGSQWRQLHEALAPAFSPRALANLCDVVVERADAALSRALVDSPPGAAVDLERLFTLITIQVIEQRLFGASTCGQAESDALAAAVRVLSSHTLRDLFIPWDWLRRWPCRSNGRRRQAQQVLDTALLRRTSSSPCWPALTDEERLDNLRSMLLAGHDTAAQSLQWWCCLMAHHPDVVERAQAELDAALGDSKPTTENLGRLPLLSATVKEALRLYPAVPVLALRQLRASVTVGSWTLPRGALLRIAPWVLQRDSSSWPAPKLFQPERFMPNAAPVPRGAWMPFGAGHRACIGRHLALLEMTAAAAVLLQRCTPVPLPGAALSAYRFDVVLRPVQAPRVALVPRPAARSAPISAMWHEGVQP